MLLERDDRRSDEAVRVATAQRAAVFNALSVLFCPVDTGVLADRLDQEGSVRAASGSDDRLRSTVVVSPEVDGLAVHVQAIELLASLCCVNERLVDPRQAISADTLSAARAWVLNVGNMGTLSAEYRRLFGGRVPEGGLPEVAPYGAWYFEDAEGSARDVSGLYTRAGYNLALPDTCPTHVANELGFVARCLSDSGDRELRSDGTLDEFMRTHLMNWALLFAAATGARAQHPVLKFAGLALEDTLFVEWERLRN